MGAVQAYRRLPRGVAVVRHLPAVRGHGVVLSVVPQSGTDRLDEARALLYAVESWRPVPWVVLELLLLPLVGVGLLLGGLSWGCLLIGSAVSLALSRYGPNWWPGKR